METGREVRQLIGNRGKLIDRHEEQEADNQKKTKKTTLASNFIKAKLWGLIKQRMHTLLSAG